MAKAEFITYTEKEVAAIEVLMANRGKHLSAKELEEAYHCGFYDLIEKYYEEIKEDKYSFIKIEKKDDDYIVHLNDELFNDIEPDEE